MNRYEIMYLVSPKIKDEDLSPLIEQIRTLITKQDGKIFAEEDWGKKKLAYPIKHYRHGFYYIVYADIDPLKIKDLEKDLKLSDDILRYLIIKHEPQTWQAIEDQKKRAAAKSVAATEAAAATKAEIKPDSKIKTETKPAATTIEPIKTVFKKEKEAAKEARKDEAKKEKAKLDELDKKLDEILDEDIIE
jgi:small subunit ribosomal protein S6